MHVLRLAGAQRSRAPCAVDTGPPGKAGCRTWMRLSFNLDCPVLLKCYLSFQTWYLQDFNTEL